MSKQSNAAALRPARIPDHYKDMPDAELDRLATLEYGHDIELSEKLRKLNTLFDKAWKQTPAPGTASETATGSAHGAQEPSGCGQEAEETAAALPPPPQPPLVSDPAADLLLSTKHM